MDLQTQSSTAKRSHLPIRADLKHALEHAWALLGQPGTWWDAEERVAIAHETRQAAQCPICASNKLRISQPREWTHSSRELLSAATVEAIHRIRNDAGRIGRPWFDTILAGGMSEERYVELVSIVAVVVAVDSFGFGLSKEPQAMPPLRAGEPSRCRPRGAAASTGWVSVLTPDDRSDADPDLYRDVPGPRQRSGANIHLALSLVPRAMIHWWDLFEAMYLTSAQMRDYSVEYRAISHAQIEMAAARTAALNKCSY